MLDSTTALVNKVISIFDGIYKQLCKQHTGFYKVATHSLLFLSAREHVMRQLRRYAEIVRIDPHMGVWLHNIVGLYDPSFYTRLGVHGYLFSGAIEGQGTDELVKKYLDDARKMNIIGVFGMTEMASSAALLAHSNLLQSEKLKSVGPRVSVKRLRNDSNI